jgi:hypothetical protein
MFPWTLLEGFVMFRTRMLAQLLVPVLGAMTLQTLAAEEPVGTTRPARSIREWMTTPSPTQPSSHTTRPAQSVREWMTQPAPTTAPCPTASPAAFSSAAPAASPAATPAVSAVVEKSRITISITSTLRQGNLVVELDGVPIFNEEFRKPLLLISQTTTWDPLQVVPGPHRISAKVYGTKKTYFSSDYDLHVSRTKATALRFVMQGDKLTVELAS